LLRCMSLLMAHRVISLRRNNSVAFGAKRTLASYAARPRDRRFFVHFIPIRPRVGT
jgi:hypothetical protein